MIAASDCFEMGRLAYVQQDYYHTVLWMQQAMEIWDEDSDKIEELANILDYLSYSSSMVRGVIKNNY